MTEDKHDCTHCEKHNCKHNEDKTEHHHEHKDVPEKHTCENHCKIVVDCSKCNGHCCRYVIVEIDEPKDQEDIDHIGWLLSHENIQIFYDSRDQTWNVLFHTNCKNLGEGNKCNIYDHRFEICKDYGSDECEKFSEDEYYKDDETTFDDLVSVKEFLIKQGKEIKK